MTKGMRMLIMFLFLIAIVAGMMQCMQKSMAKKKALPAEGRAPAVILNLAGTDP